MRSLTWITDDAWPSDEGWPYPDSDADVDRLDEPVDPAADLDVDLVCLHVLSAHLLDDLDPLERTVVTARYGLDGASPRSMRDIQRSFGLSGADARDALGGGLEKLRTRVR